MDSGSDNGTGTSFVCIDSCRLSGQTLTIRPSNTSASNLALVNDSFTLKPNSNGNNSINTAIYVVASSGTISGIVLNGCTTSAGTLADFGGTSSNVTIDGVTYPTFTGSVAK